MSWGGASSLPYQNINSLILQKILPAGSSAPEDELIPSPGLELWQNAPNPFASITKFVCEAKESTEAEIAVYNIRGQKVRKIHSGILERGSTEFSWDGFDDNKRFVANEIYLIRAHNGKSSRLIKVLKLR